MKSKRIFLVAIMIFTLLLFSGCSSKDTVDENTPNGGTNTTDTIENEANKLKNDAKDMVDNTKNTVDNRTSDGAVNQTY